MRSTFMDSAKRCFDAAALKTSEVIETSRLYLDVNRAQRKLDVLFENFGRAVYNTRKEYKNDEKLAQKLYNEIDQAKEELIDAKRKLEDSKGIRCRMCGQRNPYTCLFCSRCGEMLKK